MHDELVRQSFALIQARALQAVALVYDKLFERDPSVSALFRNDMAAQSRRLFEMIGDAMGLLEHPEQLDAVQSVLGARHSIYGVRDAHYEAVGGHPGGVARRGLHARGARGMGRLLPARQPRHARGRPSAGPSPVQPAVSAHQAAWPGESGQAWAVMS